MSELLDDLIKAGVKTVTNKLFGGGGSNDSTSKQAYAKYDTEVSGLSNRTMDPRISRDTAPTEASDPQRQLDRWTALFMNYTRG